MSDDEPSWRSRLEELRARQQPAPARPVRRSAPRNTVADPLPQVVERPPTLERRAIKRRTMPDSTPDKGNERPSTKVAPAALDTRAPWNGYKGHVTEVRVTRWGLRVVVVIAAVLLAGLLALGVGPSRDGPDKGDDVGTVELGSLPPTTSD